MKVVKRLLFILTIGSLVSCDGILDQIPETAVTNANVWTSEKDVEGVFNSMQYALRDGVGPHNWLYGEMRAQSVDNYTNYSYQHVFTNSLDLLNSGFYSWAGYYKTISLANLILDNISKVTMDDAKREYYQGTAYFVRAYSYFKILTMWGEAPLYTSSSNVLEMAKASKDEIGDQIVKDALAAKGLLKPWSKISEQLGESIISKQYACEGAVDALLAHVYAWLGSLGIGSKEPREYLDLSIASATDVIESPEYELVDNPEEVCIEVMYGNSTEGIFEMEFDEKERGGAATLAYYIVGYPIRDRFGPGSNSSMWPLNEIVITNELVESIYDEPGDLRLNSYFYDFEGMKEMDESITKGRAYPQKWRHPIYDVTEDRNLLAFNANAVVFRLADIYLLRAEIYNRIGETDLAIADLDEIRDRAGLAPYSAAINGDLKLAILKERQRELYLEGYRFEDLVRNGELRNMVSTFKNMTDTDMKDGAEYLPIASGAFLKNPQMRQNVYWKRNGF
ncbi:MAG: RagB/SusD family nutrient uptake outer membrane protein [Marinifilaceae bacterium]|nr:RagB/SusD family nutrient uptake outer membrane protein [Marinifilaceae bacterium]